MELPPCPCRIDAAISPRTLADRRITHIVSVGSEPIPADNPASGIRHLRIRVEDVDYADLLIHLPVACRFIHEAINAGGTVLVHCVQGLSRSATVVAAYREYCSYFVVKSCELIMTLLQSCTPGALKPARLWKLSAEVFALVCRFGATRLTC